MIITYKFLKQLGACKEGIKFFERNFPLTLFPDGLDISKIKITGDYRNYFHWIKYLAESEFEYDNDGNLIKRIFPYGFIEEYNSNGDLTKKYFHLQLLKEFKYEYDEKGNKIKKIYSNGYIEEYNSYGDIVKQIFSGKGTYITKYKYDEYGNLIKIISPSNVIGKYKSSDKDIEKYQYEYNKVGNITKVIYSDGKINEYNDHGHLIREFFLDDLSPSKIEVIDDYEFHFKWFKELYKYQYEYDNRGNMIKKIFPDGTIREYIFKYDSLGRLIQVGKCNIKYFT